MNKSVIFSFIFLGIMFLSWILFFTANKPINTALFYPKNILDIRVYHKGNSFTIKDRKKIALISNALKIAKKLNISHKGGKDFTDLYFTLKNGKEEMIRVSDDPYHGIIIITNNTFYKNDSIPVFITRD